MKPTIWQVLSQWVFLPIITFLLGVSGTYWGQIMDIRERTILLTRDVASQARALDRESEERKADDASLRTIAETVIKQNTEVIALFRVQQQIVR